MQSAPRKAQSDASSACVSEQARGLKRQRVDSDAGRNCATDNGVGDTCTGTDVLDDEHPDGDKPNMDEVEALPHTCTKPQDVKNAKKS